MESAKALQSFMFAMESAKTLQSLMRVVEGTEIQQSFICALKDQHEDTAKSFPCATEFIKNDKLGDLCSPQSLSVQRKASGAFVFRTSTQRSTRPVYSFMLEPKIAKDSAVGISAEIAFMNRNNISLKRDAYRFFDPIGSLIDPKGFKDNILNLYAPYYNNAATITE
jgi:hypothetical protein